MTLQHSAGVIPESPTQASGMSRRARRALWVGTHGRERVEVIILRECKAWTLCRVVHTGMVERMHPDEIRPI